MHPLLETLDIFACRVQRFSAEYGQAGTALPFMAESVQFVINVHRWGVGMIGIGRALL